MECASLLKEALSEEEYKSIPENLIKKIDEYFDRKFGEYLTAKAVYETGRSKSEQRIEELEKQLAELKEKYDLEKSNLEAASKNITQLEEQVEKYRSDFTRLNEACSRAENEAANFRRQRDVAIDERDSNQIMLDRRSAEVERLQADVKSLSEQLKGAVTAKCEALAKAQEVESMKTNLEYREQRIEQERTLFSNQIQNLTEDLNKRVNELVQIRRENTTRTIALQSALDAKTEELKNAQETIKSLSETNNEMSIKIETLVQRLKDQREAENRYHDSFTQELQAQTKMADLYKDMCEDNKTQINELTDAVTELQKLLNENSEQYGELETRYKELQLNFEETVNKKNECIELLKKELEDANDLLKSTREQKLETVIESLAPSAAATSRLIKPGMSLTQLYSQYISVSEEVIVKDAEIRRLNTYIEAIIKELDEKAPMIRKQREEYEIAVDNVSVLSKQNDSLTTENRRLQEEHNHLCSENEQLKSQLNDLGRQVCFLLQEIEGLRSASVSMSNHDSEMNNSEYHNSSDIISKRLVTFSTIEELQSNNQKLLALVRELSSKQEEAEIVSPAEVAELRAKITEMREHQVDLLQSHDRQTKMLNTLIRQRDYYKNLCITAKGMSISEQEINNISSTEDSAFETIASKIAKPDTPIKEKVDVSEYTKEIEELRRKLDDTEKMVKALKEEYENYQKEKSTNETMINEQLEALRTENRNLIQNNCKLTSVIELKDEQIKISKSNIDILKKQIESLEKKNNTYSNIIMKHEESAKHLTDEALNAQSKLSRAEVMLDNLRQENKLLKDSESRLLRERDALQRESHGQSLLLNNLESIKASFERSEAEGKIRLEQRLDELSRECSALRRRLQEEQDRFRELSAHLERQVEVAKERMEEEKQQATKLRGELAAVREELQEKVNFIDELHKKMKHNIIHDGNPLREQIRALEKDLDNAKSEVKTLQQQLKSAKLQAVQYCDVSENAEKELRELNETYQKYKSSMEEKLQACAKTENELKQKIAILEQEVHSRSDGQRDTANDLRNQLIKSKDELATANSELQNLQIELEVSKAEILRLNETIQETEDKYTREMLYHSDDIKQLAALKEEMNKMAKERNELIQSKEEAIKALELSKESWKKQEECIQKEKEAIKIRLDDVEKQNSILHTQLETLSTQLTISQVKQNVSLDAEHETSAPDISFNRSLTEDDVKSADQLLQIIKFLRREKDLLLVKFDILQAENNRVKSQLDLVTKQLEEAKVSETNARVKSDADVVTIAKHNEVLRKVETLNAITDSNRILREERDTLLVKIKELSEKTTKLEEELAPLQEKNRELTMKLETVQADNQSLKADSTRWRQRANTLIERANRTTPEDWRRLQQERENLAKLLMTEKDNVKKANEAKTKLEQQLGPLQKQHQLQLEQIKKLSDELTTVKALNAKVQQELEEAKSTVARLTEENSKLYTEFVNKTKEYKALTSKYAGLRNLAQKYKKQVQEDKPNPQEPLPVPPETQEQYREEGRREINERVTNLEKAHNEKIQELNAQVTSSQEEMAKLRKENEQLKLDANSKYERSQNVLRSAKAKIQNLNEINDTLTREINELRNRVENQDNDSRVNTMKSQYESKIARLEKEKSDYMNERQVERDRSNRDIELLNQHLSQLQRQLGQLTGSKPSTSSGPVEKSLSAPPTANIKPMAGQSVSGTQSVSVPPRRTGETPFASIRPISMPQRSVTVFPTSVNATTSGTSSAAGIAVSPQQIVHTTGSNSMEVLSSSPTSSHTDYMPATSSASPAVQTIRQIAVPPTQQTTTVTIGTSSSSEEPPSAAESTQDMEAETATNESQQVTQQQTQQAVALVLPRVEQVQASENESQSVEQSSSSSNVVVASSQPASSSNTVTTSQAGSKRTRETDGDSSTNTEQDDQQNTSQPQAKRTRIQVMITESGTEVEYQVPTSSQRDQEDDVICVDSDDEEEEGPDDGVEVLDDPDDGDGDGQYEEVENGEECYEAEGLSYDNEQEITESYGTTECGEAMEQEQRTNNDEILDNNEVEVIDENMEAAPNVSGTLQSSDDNNTARQNQGGAQSEAISSASSDTSHMANQPASSNQHSFSLRGRNITPLSQTRQSQMMIGHGFTEESGDDGIVPSTPTLYVPRRTDGFGEAVSSPHVPSGGRFTFSDPLATTGSSNTRTSNVPNNESQMETIEESRMVDPLEDSGTGRSVPTTPLQVSPQGDAPQTDNNVSVNEESTPGEVSVGDSNQIDQSTSSTQEDQQAVANIPEITITVVRPASGDQTSVTGETSRETSQSQESGTNEDDVSKTQSVAGTSDMVGTQVVIEVDEGEAEEGADGVSSEGEKPAPVEETEMEEGREAEASQSPSSNTRRYHRMHNVQSEIQSRSLVHSHDLRPIPIVWTDQQNQGASVRQTRGNTYPRVQRGRRGNARRAQQNNYKRY